MNLVMKIFYMSKKNKIKFLNILNILIVVLNSLIENKINLKDIFFMNIIIIILILMEFCF